MNLEALRQTAELLIRCATSEAELTLSQMEEAISSALARGNKLMLCGNGGSAADAQHLAAELLVRMRPDVNRQGIPAIALTMDASTLSGYANDYGFEGVFERMVQTIGQPGDVLVGISTSGQSENVVRALRAAQAMNIVTVGLLGAGGGSAVGACDHAFVVPSNDTAMIQTVHITVGHALLIGVEDSLIERGVVNRTDTAPLAPRAAIE